MPRFRRLSESIRRTKSQPFLRRQSRHLNAVTKANTKANANPTATPDIKSDNDDHQHPQHPLQLNTCQQQQEYEFELERVNDENDTQGQHQLEQEDDRHTKSHFRPFSHNENYSNFQTPSIPTTIPSTPSEHLHPPNRRKTIGGASVTPTSSKTLNVDRPSTSIFDHSQYHDPISLSGHHQAQPHYQYRNPSAPATPITSRSVTPLKPTPHQQSIRRYVNVSVADFTAPAPCTNANAVRRSSLYDGETPDVAAGNLSLDIGTHVNETFIPTPPSLNNNSKIKTETVTSRTKSDHDIVHHRNHHPSHLPNHPCQFNNYTHNPSPCHCPSHHQPQSMYSLPNRSTSSYGREQTLYSQQPSSNCSRMSTPYSPLNHTYDVATSPYAYPYPLHVGAISPGKKEHQKPYRKRTEMQKDGTKTNSTKHHQQQSMNQNYQFYPLLDLPQKKNNNSNTTKGPQRLPSFATLSSASPDSSLLSTTFSAVGTATEDMSVVATDALSLSRSTSPSTMNNNTNNVKQVNNLKTGEYGGKQIDAHFFDTVSSDEEDGDDGGYEDDIDSDYSGHERKQDEDDDEDGIEFVGLSDFETTTTAYGESCDYLLLPKDVSRVGSEVDMPSSVHSLFNSIPSVHSMGTVEDDDAQRMQDAVQAESESHLYENLNVNVNEKNENDNQMQMQQDDDADDEADEYCSDSDNSIVQAKVDTVLEEDEMEMNAEEARENPPEDVIDVKALEEESEEETEQARKEEKDIEDTDVDKENGSQSHHYEEETEEDQDREHEQKNKGQQKPIVKNKTFLPSSFWRHKISTVPKPVKYTFRPSHKVSSGNLVEELDMDNERNHLGLSNSTNTSDASTSRRKQEGRQIKGDRLTSPPNNANETTVINDQYLSSLSGALTLSASNSPSTKTTVTRSSKDQKKSMSTPNTPSHNYKQSRAARWLLSTPGAAAGVKATMDNVGTRAMVEATMPAASRLIFHKKWTSSSSNQNSNMSSNYNDDDMNLKIKRPSNESNMTNLSNSNQTNTSTSSTATEYYEDDYTKFIEKKKTVSPLKSLLPSARATLRASRMDCRSNSTLSVSTSDDEYRPFSARLQDGAFNDDDE